MEKAENIRPIAIPPAPIFSAITGSIGEIIPMPIVRVNRVNDVVKSIFWASSPLSFTESGVINKVYIRFPSK